MSEVIYDDDKIILYRCLSERDCIELGSKYNSFDNCLTRKSGNLFDYYISNKSNIFVLIDLKNNITVTVILFTNKKYFIITSDKRRVVTEDILYREFNQYKEAFMRMTYLPVNNQEMKRVKKKIQAIISYRKKVDKNFKIPAIENKILLRPY